MSTSTPSPASSSTTRPTEPGTPVIVPHVDRPLLGEIVAADPRPTFEDPDRVVITVAVDERDTTIRALAQDAEVPIA
mgnify:CR=1 FL=1